MRAALVTTLALIVAACRPSPADDEFAQRFVEQLRKRDPAGAAALDPRSTLPGIGWDSLTRGVGPYLPSGPVDSVRLVAWEDRVEANGKFKKLTYYLYDGEKHATALVWLVTRGGRRYVNTVAASGLAPNVE